MMTGKEALDLANSVLTTVGEESLVVPVQTGTEREKIEAVLCAYAARLRKNQPRFSTIKNDRMLPDIVVHRLTVELGKMK